jgi:2,4-dienoyl-CoA reductase-like NADH-dependent reductase (Old Yellow Enzyme family)
MFIYINRLLSAGDDRNLGKFKLWADACRSRGAQTWMQINHPGRQLLASLGQSA